MKDHTLQWHPGFQAVLQIELWEDREFLTFYSEYNLAQKPMQIDTLIIKQVKGHQIRKCIGKLFRQYNIVEYKSPRDYLSINDFYKVMGYACFYQSDTAHVMEHDPEEITITLISYYYPKKLIRHLKKVYHVSIQKQYPGIYYVTGMMFSIQILITNRLSPDETMWLSRLRENLKIKEDIEVLANAYKGKENNPLYTAAMDLIIKANPEPYKEAKKMCEALRELFAEEWAQAEEQMTKKQAEIDQKQAEIDQKQAEVDQKQAEVDQKQAEVDQKQAEVDQKQAEVDQKQAEITQKQLEMDQKQSELIAMQSETLLELLNVMGEVSDKLHSTVRNQKNLSVLVNWISIAVKTGSVHTFEQIISEPLKSA